MNTVYRIEGDRFELPHETPSKEIAEEWSDAGYKVTAKIEN